MRWECWVPGKPAEAELSPGELKAEHLGLLDEIYKSKIGPNGDVAVLLPSAPAELPCNFGERQELQAAPKCLCCSKDEDEGSCTRKPR